jgi:rod shape-determining protein MreD
MSSYLAFPVMALLAAAQASLAPRLSILGVHADLVLIVALAWGLVRGAGQGLLWMFAGALFLDLLYNGPFGINLLAAVPVALLAVVPETNFLARGVLLPLAAMAAGTLFYHLVAMALLAFTGERYDWLYMVGNVVLPATLVNTLLIPVCYWPLRGLRTWLVPASRVTLT